MEDIDKIQFVFQCHEGCHAGGKAPRDVEEIAECAGFRRKNVVRRVSPSRFVSTIFLFEWMIKSFFYYKSVCKNSAIFLQFPSYFFSGRRSFSFIEKLRRRKSCRVIVLVHDVDLLRGFAFSFMQNAHDYVSMMSRIADVVIVHNDTMREWFASNGFPANRVVSLTLFDYLSTVNIPPRSFFTGKVPAVVVAGNLGTTKTRYLLGLKLVSGVEWHLCGPGYDELAIGGRHVHYCGCFLPEELPGRLTGDFGLVWDGDSVETCCGRWGEYLRYNNPHKLSLYLSAGLPVVVWSHAAVADFVRSENVGVCVDSLYDLPSVLSTVTDVQYAAMQANARRLSNRLRDGYFLRTALEKAMALCGRIGHEVDEGLLKA